MSTLTKTLGSLFLAGFMIGCAPTSKGTAPPAGTDGGSTYDFVQPTFTSLAPTTVALGDTVKVFGKDFVDDKHGTLSLFLKGSFVDTDGTQTVTKGIPVPLTYIGPGEASFVFGPNVIFAPGAGDTLGTFTGNFQVVSTLTTDAANGESGDMQISEPQTLAMTAAPSIFVDQIRSVDSNCQAITTATTGSTNIALGTHLLGMSDATTDDPITYTYTFSSPGLTASYAQNTNYNYWPLDASAPQQPTDTGNFSFSYDITTGTSALVDPQSVEQVVTVSPPVTISQVASNLTTVKLAKLSTGAYTDMGNTNFTIQVKATKKSGASLTRVINFPVFSAVEVQQFTGAPVLKQIYDPELASGCIAGGALGLDYNYSEGSSESKSRTVNMSWNVNQAVSYGLQVGATVGINLGLGPVGAQSSVNISGSYSDTWSQTFGVDVSQQVSTETHVAGSYTEHILPSYFGVSYRQPARYERSVPVIYHSACGESGSIGTATLTDWQWNFDVTQGPTCQPLPAATLPPAQSF